MPYYNIHTEFQIALHLYIDFLVNQFQIFLLTWYNIYKKKLLKFFLYKCYLNIPEVQNKFDSRKNYN